jgi:hypothetical protein
MNDKPIEKWSLKELKAEVDLYRQANVENVPDFEAATKEEVAAWIIEERLNVGQPSTLAEDGDLGKAGDIIIVPPQPVTPPAEPEKPEEKPKEDKPKTFGSALAAAPAPQKQLFFRKKAVVSVENKLVNGRVYKQVTTPDKYSIAW